MTSIPRRRWWHLLACVTGSVLLAGVIAPFVNAAMFGGRIQQALQSSLGRPVSFGAVHFTLLPGPGFSLEDVSIEEDPKFGLEQFASVPSLQARLRVGSLLRGRLAFSSLHMDDPSLNIVRRADGSWNVVELVTRLTTPSRLPLDIFPAFSLSGGRLNFKLGSRKSILYVTDTDVSLYPERSGKLYVQFSGSPARSDRAGNGFGHVRGTANWYLQPLPAQANQLELSVTLDPSNVSELTTLIEGQDAGVHGTVSSHARVEGPMSALRVDGDLQLSDVHRWDLMPSGAGALQARYTGTIDLQQHTLVLQTSPATNGAAEAVGLRLRVNNLLGSPAWSVLTFLHDAPAGDLLPFGRRLGVPVPEDLKLSGSVNGEIGYAPQSGFSGALAIENVIAEMPDFPALRSQELSATVGAGVVRVSPARIETASSGTIEVGGQYDTNDRQIAVSFHPVDFSMEAVKSTAAMWFGSPVFFESLRDGTITGDIDYVHSDGAEPVWSGRLQFAQASIAPPGLAEPLTDARGQLVLDAGALAVDHLSAQLGAHQVSGWYRYRADARESERVSLTLDAADLGDLQAALEPTLESHDFLARLGMKQRQIPAWLAARRMQADFAVNRFSIDGTAMGGLRSRLVWTGTRIEVVSCDVKMPEGTIHARGSVNVAANTPRYQFEASVDGFPWHGGLLNADGTVESSGLDATVLRHLSAEGTFSADDVSPTAADELSHVSGAFTFTLAEGWPDLKLSHVQAAQGDEAWTGTGASQSDGTLVLDLEREGRQRRLVSSWQPDRTIETPGLSGKAHSR